MKFIPQRRNLNKHTPHGLRLLEKSLQQDGFIDAQTAAADGEMISGSARLEVAADKFADVEPIIVESDGTRPVVVVRTDIPNLADPRARRLSVAANQIAKTDFDPDGELLKEWGNEDKDIKAMFAESEWEEITGEEKPVRDAEPQIDRAAELLEKWKVKTGDLWQIGDHRLICGDCTDPAVVARVMGDDKADMVFTDPPYAIYGSSTGVSSAVADDKMILPFFREILNACKSNSKPYSHVYVCCDWRSYRAWVESAERVKIPIKNVIVWDKGDGGLGAMFQQCHEFILFLTNDAFNDKMFSAKGEKGHQRKVYGTPNIWRFPRVTGEEREHNAAKPVEMVERALSVSSEEGNVTLELFSGSGTTLVACQNLGRRGRAIEISPAYVAVALQRMADAFPGIEIRKLE